jgi:fimbrial chaperone protein
MLKKLLPLFVLALSAGTAAQASTFGVSPIRVDLAGSVRTSAVVVTNNAKTDLPLKIDAVSWTMDEAGQELYEPSSKLLFFPREMTIPPGESRTIRVGLEPGAAPTQEDTYRLFIRQQPTATLAGSSPTQVAVVVNFGVPVFVRQPGVKPQLQGKLVTAEGKLVLQLENVGSAHTRLESVGFKGETEPLGIGSPYVLRGLTRTIPLSVSDADCTRGKVQKLVIEHNDTKLELDADLNAVCK